MFKLATVALFLIAGSFLAGPCAAQVTAAQATAFFADLDAQLLPGRGPDINAMYLPGVVNPTPAQLMMAAQSYARDLNQTKAAASARYAVEAVRGRGGEPTQAQLDAYTNARTTAGDSGALNRISMLQFNIMKKHFPTADGMSVDFAKAQSAITQFANGNLRTGAPGTREMNGLSDWYDWKNVAATAIDAGVQQAQWTSLLPSIEIGLEIYRQVYPPRPLADGVGAAVQTSNASRFDATKQLAAAAIAALANAVNPLTTQQILTRERGNLTNDTAVASARPPSNGTVTVVSITGTGVSGGEQITLLADVTDPSGGAINTDQLEYLFGVQGLEVQAGTFSAGGFLSAIGGGEYETSFFAPKLPIGLWYWVQDDSSTSVAAGTIATVPEPTTWAMIALGFGGLGFAYRRSKKTALAAV